MKACKPRKPLAPRIPESKVQAAIVDYLRRVMVDAIVFAIPNASRRTKSGRASNGVAGLTPGIPDLCAVTKSGRALFIEVKTDRGELSDAQDAMVTRMMMLGIPCAVAQSIDDARVALAHFGFETREAKE